MRFKQYLCESASSLTTLQESLHCIGLGITQLSKTLLTKDSLLDGDLFSKSYDTYCNVDIGLDSLFGFTQNNPSWVTSVVNNTNALKKTKWFKSNRYTFYRSNGIMKDVYNTSSSLLKKQNVKLNLDKWNPGDIWASTLSSIPSFDDITLYNNWISEQLHKGSLIGISLKKSGKSPKVEYVNQGGEIKSLNYKGIKKPKSVFNTGINILSSDPIISLTIRSFRISATNAVTSELNIKGSSARHGKSALTKYIKKYNIPWMTLNDFKKNADDIDKMNQMVISLWKDCGFIFNQNQIEKDWAVRSKESQYNINPAGYYRSIINSLQFGAFMNQNKGLADEILTDIYLTGSSKGEFSSDFIKVY